MQYNELYRKSFMMRKRFLELFTNLGFGHTTSAFSMTELLVTLYTKIMNFKADEPEWSDRDRFVLSKSHGAGMLCPIYEDVGFFSKDEMENVLRIGGDLSKLRRYFYPGFEFYGGSLGIGLGVASGLALGAKMERSNWLTFCVVGDAECYEGSIWEAAMFAGHNRLNNLIVIVDRNSLGCSDFTENMLSLEPFADKWKACGFDTKEIDGHSYREILAALNDVRVRRSCKPLCIIAHSVKGKGLNNISNIPLMHGYVPKGDEAESAFAALEDIGHLYQ